MNTAPPHELGKADPAHGRAREMTAPRIALEPKSEAPTAKVGPARKSSAENRQLWIESRRACPELVERGRLSVAQHEVLSANLFWMFFVKTPTKSSS